ncbi:hypothetical protein S58_64810 [Bradyrhizobium oligotrophicum S58]|uniref:Uncharacterized protein n=1 Tax=Bradyrhizobium oligotrophicum S58 TaxID=1245469 RepID=M4ZFA9_9BRAD|nr:hypothetical protein S58_64810 [Bradyrhizobium oligotrophicum S58]
MELASLGRTFTSWLIAQIPLSAGPQHRRELGGTLTDKDGPARDHGAPDDRRLGSVWTSFPRCNVG